MDVLWIWVGHLVRRGWRAAIYLTLLAGLAGGVSMTAWSAGRRTATAFERFVEYADPPELIVTFCPPGLVPTDDATLRQCFSYDAADEIAVLEDLPEVETAGPALFRGLQAVRPGEPDHRWLAGSSLVLDEETPSYEGRQILLEGRRSSTRAADEVVVNERFVEQSGVGIGEVLDITFWGPDEIGTIPAEDERLSGPTARVRVVGVVRGILDLDASTNDVNRQNAMEEAKVSGGSALAAATTDAAGYGGIAVSARDNDGAAASTAIERAFPGRLFNMVPAIGVDEIAPIREAIRYEARSAMAFGAIAALAGAVFVGQAVARQSRREWVDLPTLRALGMSNRDVRRAAGLRGAMIGIAAAVVAAGTAVSLSPLGPIGVGRRAEVDPGPSADALVLVVGTLGVLAVVTLGTWLPVRRGAANGAADERSVVGRRFAVRVPLPVTAVAGFGMTVGRRDGRSIPIGTAFAGVALAVGAGVAALGLTASLDKLTSTPSRYGASWDVSVTNVGQGFGGSADGFGDVLGSEPAVVAAAAIVGTDIEIGDEVVWAQAFRPVGDVTGIRPVITGGREPVGLDEIALGSITMDDVGVGIGDTVEVRHSVRSRSATSMTVVGTTVVNDTYEGSPGRGAVVALGWIEANAPEATADPYVVRLVPGTDVEAFSSALEERSSAVVSPPGRQQAILNVERIASLPFLLAALVGMLAIASLAHALVLSIRLSHSQLAVWKAIGFTRRQVSAAVACHATTLAAGAAMIGVLVGVVVGRLVWQLVATQIGVVSGPVTPPIGLAVSVLSAVVVANVIAAYPAWRAARLPTAEALRVE